MAVLTKPVSTGVGRMFDLDSEELPVKGTFVATCIDVKDAYGVQRRKFQSEEMETVDLTAFLFGYRDESGKAYKISTKSMKISGNEKAALYLFLKAWLGQAPSYGLDTASLKGKKALITVDHEIGKMGDREFANIITISPLPAGMADAPAAKPKAAKLTADQVAKAKQTAQEFGGEASSEDIPF
jgi:hypothetical protein